MSLSPRGRYRKGARLEYRTMRYLEAAGFQCFRMAGSHSPFDVIAIGKAGILLIQVKAGTAKMTPLELEKVKMFVHPPCASKFLCRWPDRARQPILSPLD